MNNEENANLTIFRNGLRLVTRHVPNSLTTKIRFRINAGSRDEIFGNHKRGVSHVVEHTVFKGSRDYPEPSQASKVIEQLGGSIWAATDFDAILLDVVVPKDAVAVGIHALGDIVSHPFFPPQAMERERRRIQNEWLDGQMDPFKMRFLNAIRVSSGNAALLNPVLGDRDSIAAINRQDIVSFHRDKFTVGNIVVAIEGDLDQHNIADLVQGYVDLPPGKRPSTPPPQYVGGDDRLSEMLPGTRVMMAFPMPPRTDTRSSAPHVMLAKLLGGISADSLYQKMSDEQGLVYSVGAMRQSFIDYSLLTIGFTSFAENVRANVELISAQIKHLGQRIDPEALENQHRADSLQCEMRLRDQTIGVDNLADDIAVHGHVLPREYFYRLQEAVTVPDIREAARSLLRKPPTFVASGDLRGLPSPQEIKDLFKEPQVARVMRPYAEVQHPQHGVAFGASL